jgi:nucleotide-binding universal stress UspA family protein
VSTVTTPPAGAVGAKVRVEADPCLSDRTGERHTVRASLFRFATGGVSRMKMLVGVDGSEGSTRAVEWCAAHAAALDADVVVVHAIAMPVVVPPPSSALSLPQFMPVDRDELTRVVTEQWCAPLHRASVPFRVVLKDGAAAPAIIEVANEEDADLVVTGTRGRGGFAELLVGSTSHALSHHLHRPLVIVP